MTMVLTGAATGTVSFSGASLDDTQPTGTASVELEFRADGTYWKTVGGAATQLGTWIDPQLRMKIHAVRFTGLVGDAPTNATVAEDAWHSFLDGDFSILYLQGDPGGVTGTFDVEVRRGTGAALDTAQFDLTAAVQA